MQTEDDIQRAKRLRAFFDGNKTLDAADRRVLVRALGDFVGSYYAGRQIVTQEADPRESGFGALGRQVRF